MTNADSSPGPDALRSELIRRLKTFSLSYEQNQLLHKPDFGYVVHHVIRKRRVVTIILFATAALFFAQAVHGLAGGGTYLPWIVFAGLSGFLAYRRHRRTTALAEANIAYESNRIDNDSLPPTLGDELRLNFSLAYDEHQAIHVGNDELVANSLIARHLKNSTAFGIGGVGLSLVALRRGGMSAIPFVIVIVLGMVTCFIRDYTLVRRVKLILRRHIEPTPEGR